MIGNKEKSFTGMREIHAYYDMSTKFENDFEGTIKKLIKGEDLDVQE